MVLHSIRYGTSGREVHGSWSPLSDALCSAYAASQEVHWTVRWADKCTIPYLIIGLPAPVVITVEGHSRPWLQLTFHVRPVTDALVNDEWRSASERMNKISYICV